MPKPVILVVGNEQLGLNMDMSYKRDAFCYYLRENFNCETLIFDRNYDLIKNAIEEIKFLNKTGRLIMALVIQGKHNENEHMRISRKLKKEVSQSLFITKIKNSSASKDIRGYRFDNRRLLKLIQKRLSCFNPIKNYFGVETRSESALLLSQLEKIRQKNYPDAISSANDQIVLEALRLHMLPSELVKEEFDDALRVVANFKVIQANVFKEECQIINNMSPEKREIFLQEVINLTCTIGSSHGNDVSTLAIDPDTLQYSISSGFANHCAAGINTIGKMRMAFILKMGEEWTHEKEKGLTETVIKGLIVEINQFKTPILRILHDESDASKDVLMKIGQVFIEKREFIPIDRNANLLGY